MNSKEVWSSILTTTESLSDFWNISLMCTTTAAASRIVKYTVANHFSPLTLRSFGWTHFFASGRFLLHGTRGSYNHRHGTFSVKTFSFGKMKGSCYIVTPFYEPSHLSAKIVEHLRGIHENYNLP